MSTEDDRRPLADRLRPRTLRQIIGNPRALSELRDWADEWERSPRPPRHPAAILEGPPGVGKTTAALALAAERKWTVVEMNASDARNQAALEAVAGRAALTHTLGTNGEFRRSQEGGRTLILLDEADSLSGRTTEDRPRPKPTISFREFVRTRYGGLESLASAWGLGKPGAPKAFETWEQIPATGGRGAWSRLAPAQRDLDDWKGGQVARDSSDRGGMATIARLVRECRQPMVLTVNDPEPLTRYSPVFRSHARRIRFSPVSESELKSLIRRTALHEGYTISGPALDRIVQRSAGDVRAALNDLEAIAPLPAGADLEVLLGGRDLSAQVQPLVEEVLSHPRFYRSVELSNRVDATPEDLLPWFEESVVRANTDASRRLDAMSRLVVADRFLVRARRQRVYSLWSYASETMSGGIGLDLAGPSGVAREVRSSFPQFLGAMGRSRVLRGLRQSLLQKAGRHYHMSRRKAWESTLPFLDHLFRPLVQGHAGPRGASPLRTAIVRSLELTPEELSALTGLEAGHPKILELVSSTGEAEIPSVTDEREEIPTAVAPPASDSAGARKKVQKRLGEF